MKRRCIDTGMNNTTMPGIFSRYTQEKYDTFKKWLARQMVIDQPDYGDFFTFHDTATRRALEAAAVGDSDDMSI